MSSPAPEPSATLQIRQFRLFKSLPSELRIRIWGFAFEGRQIFVVNEHEQPGIDSYVSRFLFVNWEANTEFLKTYVRIFRGEYGEGRKGTRFHPEKDILNFPDGLYGLGEPIKTYPQDMAKVHHIELEPKYGTPLQWQQLDLRCLSSICTITICSIRDKDWEIVSEQRNIFRNPHKEWHNIVSDLYVRYPDDEAVINTMDILRLALIKSIARGAPKSLSIDLILSVVFSSTLAYRGVPIYLKASRDLDHASYGRLQSETLEF